MNEKKSLLLLITNSDFSGSTRNVLDIIEVIKKHYNVTIIAGGTGEFFTEFGEDVEFFHVNELQSTLKIRELSKAYLRIRKLVALINPHFVWTHGATANLLGRVLPQRPIYYLISTVHGFPWRGFSLFKRLLIKSVDVATIALSRPSIIFLSNSEKRAAPWLYNITKNYVLYNTSRLNYTHPLPIIPQANTAVMLARVDRSKDHKLLGYVIENSKKLEKIYLVGKGTNDVSFLKETFSENALRKIQAIGQVDDVSDYISKSSLVILLSHFEALPISLIEGAKFGKPLVASNVGSVPEIVCDGLNGFLVGKDAEAIANAVDCILSGDRSVKFGEESRRLYIEKFGERRFNESVLNILGEISAS